VGLVDILHGLDLIAGRARAVGADYLLSGPLNLWFRGHIPPPDTPIYILVTSTISSRLLTEALSIGAVKLEWDAAWSNVGGRIFHGELRGLDIYVLADPWIMVDGRIISFNASDMAKRAEHVLLSRNIVRLAPLDFEYSLRDALGGSYG